MSANQRAKKDLPNNYNYTEQLALRDLIQGSPQKFEQSTQLLSVSHSTLEKNIYIPTNDNLNYLSNHEFDLRNDENEICWDLWDHSGEDESNLYLETNDTSYEYDELLCRNELFPPEAEPYPCTESPSRDEEIYFYSDGEDFDECLTSVDKILSKPAHNYEIAFDYEPEDPMSPNGLCEKLNKKVRKHPRCQGSPIPHENKGYRMLLNLGWKKWQGLGKMSDGIKSPIGAEVTKGNRRGLGINLVMASKAQVKTSVSSTPKLQKRKRQNSEDETFSEQSLLSSEHLNEPLGFIKCNIAPPKHEKQTTRADLDLLVEQLEREEINTMIPVSNIQLNHETSSINNEEEKKRLSKQTASTAPSINTLKTQYKHQDPICQPNIPRLPSTEFRPPVYGQESFVPLCGKLNLNSDGDPPSESAENGNFWQKGLVYERRCHIFKEEVWRPGRKNPIQSLNTDTPSFPEPTLGALSPQCAIKSSRYGGSLLKQKESMLQQCPNGTVDLPDQIDNMEPSPDYIPVATSEGPSARSNCNILSFQSDTNPQCLTQPPRREEPLLVQNVARPISQTWQPYTNNAAAFSDQFFKSDPALDHISAITLKSPAVTHPPQSEGTLVAQSKAIPILEICKPHIRGTPASSEQFDKANPAMTHVSAANSMSTIPRTNSDIECAQMDANPICTIQPSWCKEPPVSRREAESVSGEWQPCSSRATGFSEQFRVPTSDFPRNMSRFNNIQSRPPNAKSQFSGELALHNTPLAARMKAGTILDTHQPCNGAPESPKPSLAKRPLSTISENDEQDLNMQKGPQNVIKSGPLVDLFSKACDIPVAKKDVDASNQRYKQTGAMPKTKNINTASPETAVSTEIADLTDSTFVNSSDVILNIIDAVSEECNGLVRSITDSYSYADIFRKRKQKRKGNTKLYHPDSLLTKYNEPGSIIWSAPTKGLTGPIIANAVGQFYFGKAINNRGPQTRVLELGVGDEKFRKELYHDTTDSRDKWFNECLHAIASKIKSQKENNANIQRVLIPGKALSELLGNKYKQNYRDHINKMSNKLNDMGIKTVIVKEPTKYAPEWQLGGTSSEWILPDEENSKPDREERLYMLEAGKNLLSYFADVTIGPIKVRALIDSGASCSVLSSAIIKNSQELLSSCVETEKTVRGVGNLSIRMEATVNTNLVLGNTKAKLNFAVVDSLRLPVDAIIGNNFLHEYGAVIDMGRGEIGINGEVIKLVPKYAKSKKMTSLTHVCNTIVIPARSKMIIETSTNTTPDQNDAGSFFEPDQSNDTGLLFGRSLSIQKEGKVLIPVLNSSLDNIELNKGTCVGKVYLVPINPQMYTSQANLEEGYSFAILGEGEDQPRSQTKLPSEMFNLDHLNEGKTDVVKLLNEFPEIVSMSNYDIGLANLPPMKIETGDAEPVMVPPRRMGPLQKQKIRVHVKDMMNSGILKYSKSSWSSPLVPVTKRDGDVRPCVDLRELNSLTKFHAFPLPNIEDILNSLKKSKYFTTLDLSKGFHQLKISQCSAAKTAFPFDGNLYEYSRVAFGLKNASGYFQRSMQIVLSGLSAEECLVFIDDFIVHSKDIPSHLETLRKVFSRLAAYGLKIKPAKCQVMKEKVDYLGHIISIEGISPIVNRVQAITQYPIPATCRALKRFTGMVNWYRAFIPNCSTLLRPLTQAQTKIKLVWTDQCQVAFDEAKRLITTAPILTFPDYTISEPLILTSDGSSNGAGAYLSQKQNGTERIIGYFSKVFSESQAKLGATDKEMEALREAIKFFRPHILDRPLILRVDHRPIVEINKSKHLNSRIFRIYELLQSFDLQIEYLPGTQNVVSDALSRINETSAASECTEEINLPKDLVEIKIQGGGDSLVRAFAISWLEDELRHTEVRSKIVNEIKRNPNKYSFNLTSDSNKLIKRWEVSGVYLPIEVSTVIATIYNVDIKVHQAGGFPLLFKSQKPKGLVNLILKDGIHVNAVVSRVEMDNLQVLCMIEQNTGLSTKELRIYPGLTRRQIRSWQMSDPHISSLGQALKYGWSKNNTIQTSEARKIPKAFSKTLGELELTAGLVTKEVILNKNVKPILVPLIPSEMAPAILDEVHQALSHIGERKMIDLVRSYFFFENMREKISKTTGSCLLCKVGKSDNGANKATHLKIITKHAYELVCLDLASLPESHRGNKYLFLAIDHFSKRAAGRPIKDKSGETIASELEYAILPTFLAIPKRMLTDNGREFQCKDFENLTNKYGIRHETISPGYPESNGCIERLVGTVKTMLRMACIRGSQWDEELPMVIHSYNNTLHKSINMKPSEVFLQKASDIILPTKNPDKNEKGHTPFSIGDRVLKKIDLPASKMAPKYEPNFQIEQVSNKERTYVVRRLKPKPGQLTLLKAHHNQLKYQGPKEDGVTVGAISKIQERPSSAVRTLSRIAQQTIRPNWTKHTQRPSRPRVTHLGSTRNVINQKNKQEAKHPNAGLTGELEHLPISPILSSSSQCDLQQKEVIRPEAPITADHSTSTHDNHGGTRPQKLGRSPISLRPRRNCSKPKYLKDFKC